MDFRGQLTTAQDVITYIEGGNATITIRSAKTGTRYTYKFRRPDVDPQSQDNDSRPIWISVLTGADNTSDFAFAGTFWPTTPGTPEQYEYRSSAKVRVGQDAPSMKALLWVNQALGRNLLPTNLEVWHEGRCGRCGRKLTVPESVASGFGPECAGKLLLGV